MRCPIGIFDSGLGGLTVVRAIRRRLPAESIVYFGDTARVPYGIKSGRTVTRFAIEDCEFLCRHDPKFIVAACNTASAAALAALEERFTMPLCGVIRPGAAEAVRTGHTARRGGGRPIGVIATEATVASGAYRRAILALAPDATVLEQACPLLVPLVEEGRSAGDRIVRLALRQYLAPMQQAEVATLVLGCTHYPLLGDAIADILGPGVHLVDPAEAVAGEVASKLAAERAAETGGRGEVRFFVSDNPQRFREVGTRFLGEPIGSVSLVAPEDFFAASPATPTRAEDVS